MKYISSLALAATLLTSCASSGVDRAGDAAAAMSKAREALTEAPAKIDSVAAALEALVKGDGDMVAQYATFSSEVDALLKHRDRAAKLSEDVKKQRASFVEAWELRIQEIKNEDLKEKAQERRSEVVEEFEDVQSKLDEVREEFDPWVQDVLDLRTYLENELNPDGVDSVSKTTKGVLKEANSIEEGLEEVVEMLDDLAKRIAATKPAPPTE